MSDAFLGWYFARPDECLDHSDGREIVLGETHKVDDPPILCIRGLHASLTVLSALSYAQSAILYRVSLGGTIVHGLGKSCATERTYLSCLDATSILRKFARECALSVIDLWNAPSVVRRYLTTGDEEYRADANAAAWDAEVAARSAKVASWAAARSAAWSTERTTSTTWAAAEAAAWAAAAAPKNFDKHRLEQMALDAINEAPTQKHAQFSQR